MKFSSLRRPATLLLSALLLPVAGVFAQPPAASTVVPAIWRTQRLDFQFTSERVSFRCEEFAARLARILAAVGARLDAGTQLRCSDSIANAVSGRVVMRAPVEASAANLQRAWNEVSAVDELVARLNGAPDPKSSIRAFAAQWRSVSSTKLDAADCELLRAISRQLLPTLELRDAKVSSACASNQIPRLSARALIRVEAGIDGVKSPPPVVAGATCDPRGAACEAPDAESDAATMPAG